MPLATMLGDLCGGHGCWPPRSSSGASPDVFCEGIAVHRQGDSWSVHTCPDIPESHSSTLASGSSSVYVNGRQFGRVGDPVACGSLVATGASSVWVGG